MKLTILSILTAIAVPVALAQDDDKPKPPTKKEGEASERGQRGAGGPGGRGGRGGGNRMLQYITIFKALDKDGNGELSAKEIEGATAALQSCDKDGDGKLTGEEIMKFPTREGRGGGRGRGGEGGGERPERPKRPASE